MLVSRERTDGAYGPLKWTVVSALVNAYAKLGISRMEWRTVKQIQSRIENEDNH